MRISAIVADQAPGEAPKQRLGVARALQIRADGAKLVLELEEVRDARHMLAASLAALGGGPSVVPLDRAIYLPVGPHEPRRQTRFAIGLREAVDAPADLGLAAIQCKWAAHVGLAREGCIPEWLALVANVGRRLVAVEEGVEQRGCINGD